jgi:Flp pilus assembly protein TadB
MSGRANIKIDLIKLKTGERLLRLTEGQSGLALEKKLDARQPVVREKERLMAAFKAALAQAEMNAV